MGAAQVLLRGDEHTRPARRQHQPLQQAAHGQPAAGDGVFGFVQQQQGRRRYGRRQGGVGLFRLRRQFVRFEAQAQGQGAAEVVGIVDIDQGDEKGALWANPAAGDQPTGDLPGQFGLAHATDAPDQQPSLPVQPRQHRLHVGLTADEARRAQVEGWLYGLRQGQHLRLAISHRRQGSAMVAALRQQFELARLSQGGAAAEPVQVFIHQHGVAPGGKGICHRAAAEQDLIETAKEGNGGNLIHAIIGFHSHDVTDMQGGQGRGHALGVAGHEHGQVELRFRPVGRVQRRQQMHRPQRPHSAGAVFEDEHALGRVLRLEAVAQVVQHLEGGPVAPGQQAADGIDLGYMGMELGRGPNPGQGRVEFAQGVVKRHRIGVQGAADQQQDTDGGGGSVVHGGFTPEGPTNLSGISTCAGCGVPVAFLPESRD